MHKEKKKRKELPKSVEKGLKIFKIVKNVILGVVFAVLLCVMIITLMARVNGEAPTFFGHAVYRVTSASMVPALQVGDIILSKECDPMTLKEGDIITYNGTSGEFKGKRVTHRVVKKPYLDTVDNEYYLLTKGDDNPVEDTPIKLEQVTGLMVGKLGFLKALYDFFITPWGLLALIALIILAFLNEFINLGRAILGYANGDDQEDIQEVIDRIQRENMEEQLKEKKIKASSDEMDES